MARRGFAAVLVLAAALVPLIASGGAGAQSGDQNQCVGGTTTGSTGGLQMCTINATPGKCIQKSSSPVIVQKCIVTQTGTNNDVVVDQENSSSEQGESTQNATQITNITQQGVSNRASVSQDIRQTTHDSGGGTQKQDGQQNTFICQGGGPPCAATNTGTNTANVTQSRWADAHASGGNITQLQDYTEPGTDCTVGTPNLCAQVTQNSTTRNDVTLNQDDHLLAEASGTGSITQTQGLGDDGIDGHAIQQSTAGTPQNTENTHQHLTYDLSAPDTANQTQDPRISGGTPGGKFNLHQVGILRASAPDALEQLNINGDCVSTGTCLILQHGKINGANFTTRCQAQGTCSAFIECESAYEAGPTCTGFPPKGNPPEESLASLGFDTSDFQNAINFTFPISLPGL
jgi:hypothetical protein